MNADHYARHRVLLTEATHDFHGAGANPAATASLIDPGFVAGRFHLVQARRTVWGDAG